MNEFRVTDQGELDLGLTAAPAPPRAVARPARRATAAGAPCPPGPLPDDDWPAGDVGDWDFEPADDGDPDASPDDYQAWLAGLPAEVRAEFLAGA
ncbi:MAG TPA: hypothetical protein VK836_10840, partial [Streptosporangiaceae bacterium]|nr:hypothetical protein [Streptosporangiaceae bacterium]